MTTQILIAGFGGQGILFSGKLLAYKALSEGKELSWLPSYGPEMRGGTASCSVTISDEPVGSPIIDNPDVLIVMNLPSLDRYESTVKPGGAIFVDSSLVGRKVQRKDVEAFYIPATKIAQDIGASNLANIVLIGKVLKDSELSRGYLEEALKKVVSAKHPEMYDLNLKAIDAGYNYIEE
ncbi:MAG: 2-oxoacid:acceptor oxidoreductase family protein [Sphaerochaetaceae bacterium]|nr:2-oxoacid:acceptor oxidoreductase family protein [Sphaerochaetaceae bacterium]